MQVIVPVPPTAGVEHVQPAGGVSDWKVVFAGTASVMEAPAAALGPLFTTCTA